MRYNEHVMEFHRMRLKKMMARNRQIRRIRKDALDNVFVLPDNVKSLHRIPRIRCTT